MKNWRKRATERRMKNREEVTIKFDNILDGVERGGSPEPISPLKSPTNRKGSHPTSPLSAPISDSMEESADQFSISLDAAFKHREEELMKLKDALKKIVS